MKNSTRLYTVCIHHAQPKIFLKNHYTNFLNVELEVENFRPRQFGLEDCPIQPFYRHSTIVAVEIS